MLQTADAPPTANALPLALYTAAAVRELDRIAIEKFAIPGIQLMKRAGRAALDALLESWPDCACLHVFCGTGNNGGDGFIVAALAQQRGLQATVWQVGAADKISSDALAARRFAEQAQVAINAFDGVVPSSGVIVDALLGTGLGGDVRAPFSVAISTINASGLPVLALDIPSGLCSDTGRVLGNAVSASVTVSFIGLKQGLVTGSGPDCCGRLIFAGLDVPLGAIEQVSPSALRLVLETLSALLSCRPRHAHKGLYGHVLVVGGDHGMAGAVVMAAQAAGRVGAGLVSCATRPEHVAALVARCPEVMAHGVGSRSDLQPLLERATAIVIGPGLGRRAWGEQLLQAVYDYASANGVQLVVDADALNLLAERRVVAEPHYAQWVLTPHPGEASRLLSVDTESIQRDRFAAVTSLQQRYGGAAVLKGVGTLVATADRIGVASYGNPGMASGGMGDVLSGVLGGLLAQGLSIAEAAQFGVCLHGRAADLAAADGERGLLATDLLPHLRRLVNS